MQLRHIYFFCFNGGILVCVEVFGLAVVDMSAAQKREYKYSLTLSRLMSYIYIYMEHPFLMFLDHTQRRSTVGRTPLDE